MDAKLGQGVFDYGILPWHFLAEHTRKWIRCHSEISRMQKSTLPAPGLRTYRALRNFRSSHKRALAAHFAAMFTTTSPTAARTLADFFSNRNVELNDGQGASKDAPPDGSQ
jgi:hypothetical protein